MRIYGYGHKDPSYERFAPGDSITGYIQNGDQVLIFPLTPTTTSFPIPGNVERRSATHLQHGYTTTRKGYYEEFVSINFYVGGNHKLIEAVTNQELKSCKVEVRLLSATFARDPFWA